MKSKETIAGEGEINKIPKTINVSKRFLSRNYSPKNYKTILYNYYSSKSVNNSINKINYRNIPKINKSIDTIELNKYKIKLKRTESNSTTSISSNNEKIKKVTFSTIEIIRIQNYKKFNRLNSYKTDEIQKANHALHGQQYRLHSGKLPEVESACVV